MLHQIQSASDPFFQLLEGDPVRPNIDHQQRLGKNKQVLVLLDQQSQPQSVVCVALCNTVPREESELFCYDGHQPTVAVLYTIWSLVSGGGRKMIPAARLHIQQNFPSVAQIVTLSPLTDMARRFHLNNGARELQVNTHTVNFEYNAG